MEFHYDTFSTQGDDLICIHKDKPFFYIYIYLTKQMHINNEQIILFRWFYVEFYS